MPCIMNSCRQVVCGPCPQTRSSSWLTTNYFSGKEWIRRLPPGLPSPTSVSLQHPIHSLLSHFTCSARSPQGTGSSLMDYVVIVFLFSVLSTRQADQPLQHLKRGVNYYEIAEALISCVALRIHLTPSGLKKDEKELRKQSGRENIPDRGKRIRKPRYKGARYLHGIVNDGPQTSCFWLFIQPHIFTLYTLKLVKYHSFPFIWTFR